MSDTQTKVKYAKTFQYVLPLRETCKHIYKNQTDVCTVKDITVVFILYELLLFVWKLVCWHSRVWCVELSGGNVGGERVQREEEGGEEGHSMVWGFLKGILSPSRHLQR